MKRLVALCFVLVVGGTSLGSAHAARSVNSGTSGYETILKGVVDISFDSLFLYRYGKIDDASSHSLVFVGGLTPRYFLLKNFSLGLSLNGFVDYTKASGGAGASLNGTLGGFLGFVVADYFLRMGYGFFLKPGIGGGFLWGNRSVDLGGSQNLTRKTTIIGGAARFNFGLVYWAGQHLNLKATVDLIGRFGSEKPEQGDGVSFVAVDTGFGIGMGYTF